MRTFLLTFLGGLAALVVFFILFPIVLILSFIPSAEPPVAKNAVIQLDLRGGFADQPASDPLSALFTDTSFVEVLLRLNAAAEDPNVKGVFVRAAEMDLGSSRAEERREAFLRLKAKDKFVIAHSQGFLASGPASYRAISAADEIWMQPGVSFETPGITFETLFLGRAFNMLKVTPEIEQFYEFKNAADVYKHKEYTPAHAEAMTALADSVWTHSIADIAADRKTDPVAMRALLENSPYQAEQALELKLIDKLGWPEEAAEAAKARAKDGDLIPIAEYVPPRRSGKAVIAIVGGEGDIVTGEGGPPSPLSVGSPVFASDRVAKELLDLADDRNVDAVVFRVDSGGGSAVASDQIWRAVERLQEAGKKVVVSMGSVAASGGYYVAAGADAIVANRSTITGSIGVFGGKFAIADGLRQIGVDPDEVRVGGEFASAYSTEKLTNAQRVKLHESLDAVYKRFTGLVAEGRKLPIEKVQDIARGRVWSGEAAKANGLVDENGDLIAAINKAKVLAGFSADDKATIRLRLHRSSPFDLLTRAMVQAKVSSSEQQMIEVFGQVVGRDRAAAVLNQLGRMSQDRGAQVWTPPVIER
ncbi:MAG TPA: signal peptide peptidase SppA [Hyphomonadaceae bacterium]|nr:signal peptide peptidase SppA [Hyphomonadaceae bacterium]